MKQAHLATAKKISKASTHQRHGGKRCDAPVKREVDREVEREVERDLRARFRLQALLPIRTQANAAR